MSENLVASRPVELASENSDKMGEVKEGGFNIVMQITWQGELKDITLNDEISSLDPEVIAKIITLTAWTARNAAIHMGEEVNEIDIVMKDKFIVIFPETQVLRVGIASSV
jgi:hypothetical protein